MYICVTWLYALERVAVIIQCSQIPECDDEAIEPQPCRIYWPEAAAPEREDYNHESKKLLDQMQLPTKAIHCQNFNCSDEKLLEDIEKLHAELTSSLLAASSSVFQTAGKKKAGKFNIPGWNSVVKSKRQIAKAAFWLWVNYSWPETGGIYRNMVDTKKISNIHYGNAAKMLKYTMPMD